MVIPNEDLNDILPHAGLGFRHWNAMRSRHEIEIWQGDITELDVGAIVNAANESLLGGGGVNGAIHRAADPQLFQACHLLPEAKPGVRRPVGEVRATAGYRLKAHHVLHAVGPVWRDGAHDEPALLANCYRRSLRLAEQMGLHSVAFPAISCGVYGYPLHQGARIAVAETTAWQRAHAVPKRVILVAYGDAAYKAYAGAAAGLVDAGDAGPGGVRTRPAAAGSGRA